MKISVILLAGGKGSRMGSALPKQFLSLKNKKIIHYSLELFQNISDVQEIIIVCDPPYRSFFSTAPPLKIKFAEAGERRQDSVFNGLQHLSPETDYVCIHDGARPFITSPLVERVFKAAEECGAAAVGMPIKYTLKEINSQGFVQATPDRTQFWEIQTPQVIRKNLLLQGFEMVQKKGLTVTDDVSVIELLNLPVKVVEGDYKNIKITTPEDLLIAENFVQ